MTPSYSSFEEFGALVKSVSKELSAFVSAVMVFFCSVLLVVAVGWPGVLSDMFSSAAFFDSLDLALVWSAGDNPGGVIGLIEDSFPTPAGRPVSIEGVTLGLGIMLAQILLGFGAAISGPWLKSEQVGVLTVIARAFRREVAANDINWQKVGLFSAMVMTATLDTATDVLFRGPAAVGGWGMTMVLSLLYFNFLSEFALVNGTKYAMYGFTIMRQNWRPFVLAVRGPSKPQGSKPQGNKPQGNKPRTDHRGATTVNITKPRGDMPPRNTRPPVDESPPPDMASRIHY